uniref:RING-type domain-containing protein n=1 Tax=Steinernema glaseri TaxID=37863 RepID=A0A1I8AHJ5_9BILA
MAVFKTPCFNCDQVAGYVLACCRATYCSICIGYYFEDCEDDRSRCMNDLDCDSFAHEEFVFYSLNALEVFCAKRQAEERAEEEEKLLREAAIASIRKVKERKKAPLPPTDLPMKSVAPDRRKKVVSVTKAPIAKGSESRERRTHSGNGRPKERTPVKIRNSPYRSPDRRRRRDLWIERFPVAQRHSHAPYWDICERRHYQERTYFDRRQYEGTRYRRY